MVDSGVGGVLMESMCCMGWCSRNSLGGVGRSFLVLLDLKWGTTSRLVFGMMYGGGVLPPKGAYLELCSIAYLRDASVADHL
jgi:hypothetical protein